MFNPRQRFRQNTLLAFLFVACLLPSGRAHAAPSIALSKKSGPPTSRILVSGRGFKPHVGVDLFFDTKDKALVVTNGKGEFSDVRIHAPRGARPGEHWVTALERNNDEGAQELFLIRTDWSQFHFNPDHEGLNPYENVLNLRTVHDLGLKWTFNTPGGGDVRSSSAVVNGILYVGSYTSRVYALNPNTGALLWSYLTGSSVASSPALANGVVYVNSADENVYALDAQTGAKLWSYTTGGGVYSSPAIVNGVVYVGSDDGDVYALDADTGTKLWSYETGGPIMYSSPAVADGVVYVGSSDSKVYALKARTGAKLWSYAAKDMVRSSPAVANGLVYVGSDDGTLYALNAGTGAKVWSYVAGAVDSSPAVANGVVYFGSQDDNLYALDASSGAKLWSFLTGFIFFQSPAVANGVVYLGSYDGNLYGLDAATGAELFSYASDPNSTPAVANGAVFVSSADGKLYAFGLTHGGARRDGAKPESASMRPGLKMLRPDFSLKASQPGATPLSPKLYGLRG